MSLDPLRRDSVGSSDAPALVGVDPWKTAGDVWAQKTGRLVDVIREERAADVRAVGRALEPVLLGVVAERLERPVTAQLFYQHPTLPLTATVDGLVLDGEPVLVECKTSGLLSPTPPAYASAYGDDGTDEVPDAVRVQVAHQLAVLDAQPDLPRVARVLVPALIGGRGLRVYVLPRDPALIAELVETETWWWREHVVGDRCPPDDPPSLPTLRALHRDPAREAVPLEAPVVEAWLRARDELKRAEGHEELARRLLLACLGDAEAGICPAGVVTYRPTARAGYTVKPTTVRSLRWRPAPLKGAA